MGWFLFAAAMVSECNWDSTAENRVKAAVVLGYVLAQIPWVGRWGGKKAKWCQIIAMLICMVGMVAAPTFILANDSAPSALVGTALCFGMAFSCGLQQPIVSALQERWCLPDEKSWVSSVDCVATSCGSLANCLVMAQLMQLLGGWRNFMLLLSVITAIALFGVVFFVTPAPTATRGLMRLSDAEAALFRAQGMLADEKPLPKANSVSRSSSGLHGLTSAVSWALVGMELMTAWAAGVGGKHNELV